MNYTDIAKELVSRGHLVYIFGGAVRSSMMGFAMSDYNLVTSASDDEIKEILTIGVLEEHKVIPNTVKVGTTSVTSMKNGLFHTKTSVFGIEEFLETCDFTINAMAKSVKGDLIDPFNGSRDIKDKVIRTVGSVESTFKVDNRRALNALYLSEVLGFAVHEDIIAFLTSNRFILKEVSPRYKRDLLHDLFTRGKLYSFLLRMFKQGFLFDILPFLKGTETVPLPVEYGNNSLLGHLLLTVKVIDRKLAKDMLWGALFHDLGKFTAEYTLSEEGHEVRSLERLNALADEWGLSEFNINRIRVLVKFHDIILNDSIFDASSSIKSSPYKFFIESLREFGDTRNDVTKNLGTLINFCTHHASLFGAEHQKEVKEKLAKRKKELLEYLHTIVFSVSEIVYSHRVLVNLGIDKTKIPQFLEYCKSQGVWRGQDVIDLAKDRVRKGMFS